MTLVGLCDVFGEFCPGLINAYTHTMLSVRHFRSLRPSTRSLVFLFWIYTFVGNAVNVFMQIYLYQLFSSVSLNVVAGILTFTGIMIGFCAYGVAASVYRLNARHGFLLSFICVSLVAISFVGSGVSAISIGMYFIAGTFIILYLGARVLLALQPTRNTEFTS